MSLAVGSVADRRGKAGSVAIVAICEVAALALWFSATAVLPSLSAELALSSFHQSLFTSAVQAGFVVGTLGSATLGLADRLDPRRFFAASATIAALANAGILVSDPASAVPILLRFVTGAAMAGIYPVGMKIVATWSASDMGLLVGILVGALTLGSASSHLVNALGGLDWRLTIGACSVGALAAAIGINAASLGPGARTATAFRARDALEVWRNRPLRLVNLGYLGHMWELYAMWAWLGPFLLASLAASGAGGAHLAGYLTFVIIGVAGAAGCLGGGLLADRYGRTAVTIAAMAGSGACAAVVGFFFGGPLWPLLAIGILWGITVVADSAQFSASVAELAERNLTGTMLTVQTCLGFLLTLVTIHLMPLFVDALGWRFAFAPLALGPLFGIWAMARLRRLPEAHRLAEGRR